MNVAFKVELPQDHLYSRVMHPLEDDSQLDEARKEAVIAMTEVVRDYIRDNIVTMTYDGSEVKYDGR
jgi:hypothetical protein